MVLVSTTYCATLRLRLFSSVADSIVGVVMMLFVAAKAMVCVERNAVMVLGSRPHFSNRKNGIAK